MPPTRREKEEATKFLAMLIEIISTIDIQTQLNQKTWQLELAQIEIETLLEENADLKDQLNELQPTP